MVKLIEMLDIEYESIEEAAHYLTNGVFLEPNPEPLDHNWRAVVNYCNEHNIEYTDVTDDIVDMFRYKKKKSAEFSIHCAD